MTEQRAEQPIIPEQGSIIPLETERGSQRIWRKHAFFWGTLASSAIIGGLLGVIIKPALGVPQELSLSYQMAASGVGVILGLHSLIHLMKKNIVKL